MTPSRQRCVVALTGMPGAQKTELAHRLADLSGANVVSLSSVISAEIDRLGREPTPSVYKATATELRRSDGDDVLVSRVMQGQAPSEPFLVVDGVRTRAEAVAIGALACRAVLVAVFAPREQRFARMRRNSGPELESEADLLGQDEENLTLGVGELAVLADLVIVRDRDAPAVKQQAAQLLARLKDGLVVR